VTVNQITENGPRLPKSSNTYDRQRKEREVWWATGGVKRAGDRNGSVSQPSRRFFLETPYE